MPCFTPLQGFRLPSGRICVGDNYGSDKTWVEVPCGQCIGCRLDHARDWAIRSIHETQSHEEASFLTLTYDDEHLPPGATLDKSHLQLFWKALRKRYPGRKLRYFACGEYGGELGRPHYHAILFGKDFTDRELTGFSKAGEPIYKSEELASIWKRGFGSVGDVTFQSAGYVARYVNKKVNGNQKEEHYGTKLQEYSAQSNRPGIGRPWIERYYQDVYPLDEVIIDGKKHPPPRYYDKVLEKIDPDMFEEVKRLRIARGKNPANWPDQSTARRSVREYCLQRKHERLQRNLE